MIVRAIAVAAFLAGSSFVTDAVAQAFNTVEQVSRWTTYYYRNPEPERVVDAVRYMSAAGFLKGEKSAPPLIGFIAGILSAQPDRATALVKQLLFLPEAEQPVLVLGVWYSGLADAKLILQDLLTSMPSQKLQIGDLLANAAPRMTDLPLEEGPWVLDALWGNFIATGSDEPVRRIIGVLDWSQVRGDVPRVLVGGAARWSLTSNAVQHDRVLEICKTQLSIQKPEVATLLSEVIRNAEAGRAKQK